MTEPKNGLSSSISAVRDSANPSLHYSFNPNPMLSSNGTLNYSLSSLQPVSPLVVNKPAATLPELPDLKPSVSPDSGLYITQIPMDLLINSLFWIKIRTILDVNLFVVFQLLPTQILFHLFQLHTHNL